MREFRTANHRLLYFEEIKENGKRKEENGLPKIGITSPKHTFREFRSYFLKSSAVDVAAEKRNQRLHFFSTSIILRCRSQFLLEKGNSQNLRAHLLASISSKELTK